MFGLCCLDEVLRRRMVGVGSCDVVTHLKMVEEDLCMSDDRALRPCHDRADAVLRSVLTTLGANMLSLRNDAEILYF